MSRYTTTRWGAGTSAIVADTVAERTAVVVVAGTAVRRIDSAPAVAQDDAASPVIVVGTAVPRIAAAAIAQVYVVARCLVSTAAQVDL